LGSNSDNLSLKATGQLKKKGKFLGKAKLKKSAFNLFKWQLQNELTAKRYGFQNQRPAS